MEEGRELFNSDLFYERGARLKSKVLLFFRGAIMGLVRSTGQAIKITESGSNENGNWIKFNDGTLIQYGNKDISNIQINTSSIGNYMSAGQNINFPISFKEAISGNVSLRGGSAFFTTKRFISNTLMGYFILSGSSATLSSATLDWLVIGKWK